MVFSRYYEDVTKLYHIDSMYKIPTVLIFQTFKTDYWEKYN